MDIKMNKDIKKSLEIYKEQLSYGYIRTAYIALTEYMMDLKGKIPKNYQKSNMAFGYLDYTYFYFTNDFLKKKNLKFALALNHEKMRFELWLCAGTAYNRKKYWNLFKKSKWNGNRCEMPKYSVLEIILEEQIDFKNYKNMTSNIINNLTSSALEIEEYLENMNF